MSSTELLPLHLVHRATAGDAIEIARIQTITRSASRNARCDSTSPQSKTWHGSGIEAGLANTDSEITDLGVSYMCLDTRETPRCDLSIGYAWTVHPQ